MEDQEIKKQLMSRRRNKRIDTADDRSTGAIQEKKEH